MDNKGYTLIELILSISILAILGSLALPNLGKSKDLIVKNQLDILIEDLETYKEKAILEGIAYSFEINGTTNKYCFKRRSMDSSLKQIKVVERRLSKDLDIRVTPTTFRTTIKSNGSISKAGSISIYYGKNPIHIYLRPVTSYINIEGDFH